jgi:AGCS family alanine or glycine:cation symporter
MKSFDAAVDALSGAVFFKVPLLGAQIELIVLYLAVPMLFFTVWLGFPNIFQVGRAVRILQQQPREGEAKGDVSQWGALTTALSGTIGLGNIAGVAVALTMGGPGAILWMFVIGWFAMTVKMAEVVLGLKYRVFDEAGHVHGGPMYVLKAVGAARGWPKLGLALGGLYAFFALFGAIPMVQVNQSFAQVQVVTGITNGWGYGVFIAAAVALVTLGGAAWLGEVAKRLTPLKVGVYLFGVLTILILHNDLIPGALAKIWAGAWNGDAATGGAIGAFVAGMRRAVFASEAGVGSAVMAHSLARARHPVSEGLVALLEPLLGTMIVCGLGGLALVVADTWDDGLQGIAITSAAFAGVADWFPWVLAVVVFLFAYSTLVAWGFYGLQAWGYLFGHGQRAQWTYKILYIVALPPAAAIDLGSVVGIVDSAFFLMAIPNVIALYWCAGEVRRDVRAYLRAEDPEQEPVRPAPPVPMPDRTPQTDSASPSSGGLSLPQIVANQRELQSAIVAAKGHEWTGGWMEAATKALYMSVLSPGDFAIDAGANRGQHAVPMAGAVGPTGRVLAIEASAVMVEQLRQAVAAADASAIVDIGHYAVSDQAGSASFNFMPTADGYSSLGWDDKMAQFGEPEVETVEVHRLDDLVGEERAVAFMKLDIEGAELPALRGAARLLRRDRPVLAFENGGLRYAQRFDYSSADFFGFFEQVGYQVYTPFGTPFGREWDNGLQPGQLFALPVEMGERAAGILNPAMMRALFGALQAEA